ncbi:hypothetical protein [Streptomyces sp. NPDC002540]
MISGQKLKFIPAEPSNPEVDHRLFTAEFDDDEAHQRHDRHPQSSQRERVGQAGVRDLGDEEGQPEHAQDEGRDPGHVDPSSPGVPGVAGTEGEQGDGHRGDDRVGEEDPPPVQRGLDSPADGRSEAEADTEDHTPPSGCDEWRLGRGAVLRWACGWYLQRGITDLSAALRDLPPLVDIDV